MYTQFAGPTGYKFSAQGHVELQQPGALKWKSYVVRAEVVVPPSGTASIWVHEQDAFHGYKVSLASFQQLGISRVDGTGTPKFLNAISYAVTPGAMYVLRITVHNGAMLVEASADKGNTFTSVPVVVDGTYPMGTIGLEGTGSNPNGVFFTKVRVSTEVADGC